MEKLRRQHINLLDQVDLRFKRSLIEKLPWNDRLLGIKGARGVGKTTMILQYIKEKYGYSEKALYISLDNLYFTVNLLSDFIAEFISKGGTHVFIDEIHKSPNWAIELKNIYDAYPELKVTFTGSSLLRILNSRVDLSRRALVFDMQGLSYREFLNFTLGTDFEILNLDDLLKNHVGLAHDILKKIKPLEHFDNYLKQGYYPFFINNPHYYFHRLREIINMTIDIEFPILRGVDPVKTVKIKQLLFIVANSSPFKPNISKLAGKIGITRNTLNEYFKLLVNSKLLNMLNKNAMGINLLQKPDKIFIENTNISFAVSTDTPEKGNIRETFFLNQLSEGHLVTYPDQGDFFIDNKYLVEVGGKNKTQKQITGIKESFVVADEIEIGYRNKIPLWLFGFLY